MRTNACHIVGEIDLAAKVQESMISKTSVYKSVRFAVSVGSMNRDTSNPTIEFIVKGNCDDRH